LPATEEVNSSLMAREFVREITVQLQEKAKVSVANLALGQSAGWDGGVVEP